MSEVDKFGSALSNVQVLVPREKDGKKLARAVYTRQVVTIVGVKTVVSRFLPVSHAGYSNETYVDKLDDLLGKTRAEFIGRKLKGTERRAHMTLFRQMVEDYQSSNKEDESSNKQEANWRTFFANHFGTASEKACSVPEQLCLACWNCSLFGGLESKDKKAGVFSRVRYFDTFSVEDAAECIQTDESPEQMAIGNTVGEDLSVERSEASFHRYEYVKAGTHFPFITIIESPTLLDVAGYLAAVKLADQHGYGKYSANHGKFDTKFLAVSTGYPRFSVLNMLTWLENGELEEAENGNPGNERTEDTTMENKTDDKLKFETAVGEPVSLFGDDIVKVREKLSGEFKSYVKALKNTSKGK